MSKTMNKFLPELRARGGSFVLGNHREAHENNHGGEPISSRQGRSDQWRSHGSIIDAYARKSVGWRVSIFPHAGFVLDAPNRRFLNADQPRAGGSFTQRPRRQIFFDQTYQTVGRGRHRPLSPLVKVMTARWPRRSMACSTPKTSITAAHGVILSRSGIFHPPKPRQTTTPRRKLKPWPP